MNHVRWSSGKEQQSQKEENNEPIKFYGSGAAEWKAFNTRSGQTKEDDSVSFQPYVISACLTIFLLYFCVFREESDIDQELDKSLYDRVEGLEQTQLILVYKYNKEHGLELHDLEKRMKELGMNPEQIN